MEQKSNKEEKLFFMSYNFIRLANTVASNMSPFCVLS